MAKRITDKERLDWLAQRAESKQVHFKKQINGTMDLYTEPDSAYGQDVRAAIDAAIRASKKERK